MRPWAALFSLPTTNASIPTLFLLRRAADWSQGSPVEDPLLETATALICTWLTGPASAWRETKHVGSFSVRPTPLICCHLKNESTSLAPRHCDSRAWEGEPGRVTHVPRWAPCCFSLPLSTFRPHATGPPSQSIAYSEIRRWEPPSQVGRPSKPWPGTTSSRGKRKLVPSVALAESSSLFLLFFPVLVACSFLRFPSLLSYLSHYLPFLFRTP